MSSAGERQIPRTESTRAVLHTGLAPGDRAQASALESRLSEAQSIVLLVSPDTKGYETPWLDT